MHAPGKEQQQISGGRGLKVSVQVVIVTQPPGAEAGLDTGGASGTQIDMMIAEH
jgi:hypothetical protein